MQTYKPLEKFSVGVGDRFAHQAKAQLREAGTHQELLLQKGIYWKLYLLQYKDQQKQGQENERRQELAPQQF